MASMLVYNTKVIAMSVSLPVEVRVLRRAVRRRDVLHHTDSPWRLLHHAPDHPRVWHGDAQHGQLLPAGRERRQDVRRHRRLPLTARVLPRPRPRHAETVRHRHAGR